MKASPVSTNSSESKRDHFDKLSTILKSSTKSTKAVSLCNVQGRLYTSKKENTCKSCGITFKNFQSLLNHVCLPYRCESCCMAFLFDYMLKMHKCGSVQSHAKSSHQTHYCEICGAAFFELNLLLRHQSHCNKTIKCNKCHRTLSVRNGSEFCRKCSLIEKDRKYSLRCNNFETATISSEVSSSGIESSIETDSGTTDRSNSTFNDVGSWESLEFSNWRRRRKPTEDSSDRSSKNFKSKDALNDSWHKTAERSNATTVYRQSISNDVDFKTLNPSNWERKAFKKSSNLKELEKTVKRKNSLSIDSLEKKFKTKRHFEKLNSSLLLNKDYVKDTNAVKLSVHKGLLAKQNIESDLKKSVVSVLSQTGKNNQTEKKKVKFSPAIYNNGHKINASKSVGFEKNNVLTSDYSRSLKKNDNIKAKTKGVISSKKNTLEVTLPANYNNGHKINVSKSVGFEKNNVLSSDYSRSFKKNDNIKAKTKGVVSSKKNILEHTQPKSPTLSENVPSSVKKNIISKRNKSISQTNSKKKSNLSDERSCTSNVESCTPKLEVYSSILKSTPNTVSPVRRYSKSSPSHSKDVEPGKNKNARKRSVSNSFNDTIRLESVLHVLPDEESGILLKESSKTCDNFRCPKCNKLFKKAKMAAIHYANCKSSRIKKKMLVMLKDIEWICLQCHFHCTQIPELNNHRRLCPKSSFNTIAHNIEHYSDSPLNYCSKCSYSCMSSIIFSQHACKERIEHMKKCYVSLKRVTYQSKYRCNFCVSEFFFYSAFVQHIDNHKLDEFPDTPDCNNKLHAKQEIKNIIHEPQNFKTSDDVIEKLLEPVSNIFSGLDSENPYPSPNLNLVIPNEIDVLFQGTVERVLSEYKDKLDNVTEDLKIGDLASQLFSESDSDSSSSDFKEKWLNYIKDYYCTHTTNSENNSEEKPCIECLTAYIEKKASVDPEETQNSSQETLHSNLPEASVTISHDSEIYDSDNGSVLHDLNDSVPLVNQETLPIQIASVQSCYELASDDPIFQNSENNNFTPEIIYYSCSESQLINVASTSNSQDFDIENVSQDIVIVFITIVKEEFVESKCTIETHSRLVKSLLNLKQVHAPSDSAIELPQIKDNEYYLQTDSKEECLRVLNMYVEASNVQSSGDVTLSDSFEGNAAQFFILPSDNLNHHPNTPKVSPVISSPIHSDVLDSAIGKLHPIFDSSINLSPILQHFLMDQNYKLISIGSSDNTKNHASEIHSNESTPGIKKCRIGVKDYLLIQSSFKEVMKILVTQKPCDFDLIAINCKFIIHISWQTTPAVLYTAYTVPKCGPSNITFICGLCYDNLTLSGFFKHFIDNHEELKILKIFIC